MVAGTRCANTLSVRSCSVATGRPPQRIVENAEAGKAAGGIRHRFAVGDGELLVLDEWETAEAFHAFFDGNEAIAAVMREAGASGPPVTVFYEALDTPDRY